MNLSTCACGGRRVGSSFPKQFFAKKSFFLYLNSASVLKWSACFKTCKLQHHPRNQKISIFFQIRNLSEIDLVLSNFQCRKVQTLVGSGRVKTFWCFGQCPRFLVVFLASFRSKVESVSKPGPNLPVQPDLNSQLGPRLLLYLFICVCSMQCV